MDEQKTKFRITKKSIKEFVATVKRNGASDNLVRRYKGELNALLDYLGKNPVVTKERLQEWRQDMEDKGYSPATIHNQVVHINVYLRYVGYEELCFKRGRSKDLRNMTFGFLEAIEPTGEKYRGDIIWRCRCKCGKYIDVPSSNLLLMNTRSCGCVSSAHLSRANMFIDNTSLLSALKDTVESTRSSSGYVGVTKKRDKWQAYINYKGKYYSLGCYANIEDAVKARARAKEEVIEDATRLLSEYEELHKDDVLLPKRSEAIKPNIPQYKPKNGNTTTSVIRSDNTSGHTGIYRNKGKWAARICHGGYRYNLGAFDDIEDAIAARSAAKSALDENAEAFIEEYLKTKKRYPTR